MIKKESKFKENQAIYISEYFPEYVRERVEDPGIDEKIKKLTPEK
jgi:hypothetical protein